MARAPYPTQDQRPPTGPVPHEPKSYSEQQSQEFMQVKASRQTKHSLSWSSHASWVILAGSYPSMHQTKPRPCSEIRKGASNPALLPLAGYLASTGSPAFRMPHALNVHHKFHGPSSWRAFAAGLLATRRPALKSLSCSTAAHVYASSP